MLMGCEKKLDAFDVDAIVVAVVVVVVRLYIEQRMDIEYLQSVAGWARLYIAGWLKRKLGDDIEERLCDFPI
jgi:hypothetical protein